MPVEHEVARGRITLRADGHYGLAEIAAAFEAALAEAPSRLPVLVDARASSASPDLAELRATASYAQQLAPRLGPRVALLVKGQLRFGLARMLGSLVELGSDLELRPFTDLEAAERWLAGEPGR